MVAFVETPFLEIHEKNQQKSAHINIFLYQNWPCTFLLHLSQSL